MSSPTSSNPVLTFNFDHHHKFIDSDSSSGIEIPAVSDAAVMEALARDAPFPARQIDLGTISARAAGGRDIRFGKGSGQVNFTASGGAYAGFGVYFDPEAMIDALGFDDSLAPGMKLEKDEESYYLVLRWGYDLAAAGSGAIALGAGAITFGAEGKREGLYAVVRRFAKQTGARAALSETVKSWLLPAQIESSADLAPGTWLVAEVDGSIGVKLGARYGFDFNWVRETKLGELAGDIGLRLQLGVAAALGFQASGRYALVIGRESMREADRRVRLRLFKQRKKGWSFAFDAAASAQADFSRLLPEQFDDFVRAVFGLHGAQVIDSLQTIEKWTDPDQGFSDLLSGVSVDYAKRLLKETTGLDPETAFNKAKERLLGVIEKWKRLDHGAAAALWKLAGTGDGLPRVRHLARLIADGDLSAGRLLLSGLLQRADFFESPEGQWLEAAATGSVLAPLASAREFETLQQAARATSDLLDGDIMESAFVKLHALISERLNLGQLEKVVDETSFNDLDEWLKARLSAFIDRKLDLARLAEIRAAVQSLANRRQEFYAAGLKALARRYDFRFAAAYQQATTQTALLDIVFDLGASGVGPLLRQAVAGDFDTLLIQPHDGVVLNTATLSHGIERHAHVELTLPFFKGVTDHFNSSLASVAATEDEGRVLVYELAAEDVVAAENRRNSRLAIGACWPVRAGNLVRVHSTASLSYSYSFKQVRRQMRRAELQYQLKPYVDAYFPELFSAGGDESGAFETWLGDLDKTIDRIEFNGTDNFGDTLIALDVSLGGAIASVWASLPREEKAPPYMEMSRRLQAKLKELIPFFYFQNPEKYRDLIPAAALLAYSSIPPSTSIAVKDDKVQLNTNKDIYWDWMDKDKRRAMIFSQRTLVKLAAQLERVRSLLLATPGLASTATFYRPDRAEILLQDVMTDMGERLLNSLLFVEAEIVRSARDAGRALARFIDKAGVKPSEAVEALAQFGAKAADTFNRKIKSVYGGDAIRPLGTMLFVEAAAALGQQAAVSGRSAMLELIVVKQNAGFQLSGFLSGERPESKDVVIQQRLVGSGEV
jgi:hypothetical protein